MKEPTANEYRDMAKRLRGPTVLFVPDTVDYQSIVNLLKRGGYAYSVTTVLPADDLAVGVPPLLPVGTLVTCQGVHWTIERVCPGSYTLAPANPKHARLMAEFDRVTPYVPRYVGKGTTYAETTGEWRITDGKLEVQVIANNPGGCYPSTCHWPLADCRWLADDALGVQDE